MSRVSVITGAIRNEAKKWFAFSDRTEPIRVAAESLTLDRTAFFIGDFNTGSHHHAYGGYQEFVVNLLRGAVVEFDQIGDVLNRIADKYDEADAIAVLDLNEIWAHDLNEIRTRKQ